jgi:lysophospholipase L1-like esterase
MNIKLLIVLIFLGSGLFGQNSRFGTYYDQRKSLFEKLPDTRNEIIFLGNSITDGCEWSELFADRHIKNRGISGDITAGVLNRIQEVTSSKPAKVFVLIGINDLARKVLPDTVYANICLIASTIHQQSPKTKVYIQSILPVNDSFSTFRDHTGKTTEVKAINERLKTWCMGNDCIYVDLFIQFKNSGDDRLNPAYTNDGLHLTGDGYLHWAGILKPLMK